MSFEVELPGVYLDDVLEDQGITTGTPVLINRSPEADEIGAPNDTLIELDLAVVTTAGTVDIGATFVYVDGILAFAAGVFQPGYAGASSLASNPQADVLRIVIDYQGTFGSSQVVDVRVVCDASGVVADPLDTTYSFTTADTAQPLLLAAEARELKRVRITFDEGVLMVDASSATDALNPANWELEQTTAPSVAAVVTSVEKVNDTQLDLLTSVELTPGAVYRVYGTNFTDLFGNEIFAPFNQVTFVAFTPFSPVGRVFDLWRMIPEINRQEDTTQDLEKFVACLQEPTDLLLYDIDRFLDILDPDLATEDVVDLILLDLGNPFQFELSEIDKRRLVSVLVDMYRLKGTCIGIQNVVRFFLGLEVECDAYNTDDDCLILGESELGFDWQLGAGTSFLRYAFQIIVGEVLTPTQRLQLTDIVNYMKPAHTHFVRLVEPPAPPEVLDHLELGLSELGDEWILH